MCWKLSSSKVMKWWGSGPLEKNPNNGTKKERATLRDKGILLFFFCFHAPTIQTLLPFTCLIAFHGFILKDIYSSNLKSARYIKLKKLLSKT